MRKRRFLIPFLLALICFNLHAQSIVVQSFDLAPTDMTANTPGTMVKDQNGETCALIKVETTQKGFTFDVGMLGVTDVVEQPAEVWVYVPFGVKKITMQHSQLGMLRDYEFPCQVERGRTYIMRLATGTVRTIVEHAPTKQFLCISLEPANAILEINGEVTATNNGVYNKLHSFGKYEYRASCPNYHDAVGVIEVCDPEDAHRIILQLKPAFGHVSVSAGQVADITGAMVYIDGNHVGSIPVNNLTVSSGSHLIRVLKPLYKAYESTFEVTDNEDLVLAPMLEANFAEVTLQALQGSRIFVNGEDKGTDKWTGSLECGEYVFECIKDGYLPASMSYNIALKDHSQTVWLPEPTPVYGSLAISSDPLDAKVYIDGIYVGVTPKYIAKQIIGDYTVKVECDGYVSQEQMVTIEEGKDADLVFALTALSAANTYKPSHLSNVSQVTVPLSAKKMQKLQDKAVKLADKGKHSSAIPIFITLGEQGDLLSQQRLAEYYRQGKSVKQSYEDVAYWTRKAAQQGDIVSQNTLGVYYRDGKGLPQSYADAVYWFTLAAENGSDWGQYNLADCYYNGRGVAQNYEVAVKWYTESAFQGNASAQNSLGLSFDLGRGVEKNREEAAKWYAKSADNGHDGGQYNLAFCYYHGRGVAQNYSEAVKWYRKSADQGNADAQKAMGDCYYNAKGVSIDYNEAFKWYSKAAEKGSMAAEYSLGHCYYHRIGVSRDFKEAVKWYRKSAEQGYADAQFSLGYCYYYGEGVDKSHKDAAYWYRKSADQGHSMAQNWMGYLYYYGEGVSQSYTEAVKWHRKSAEQGNADSQNRLAACYYIGNGVAKNWGEAVTWYRKAAEQGNSHAQNMLGNCYYRGHGVDQNYTEAVKWYEKAAANGNASAQFNLGECYDSGKGVSKNRTTAIEYFKKAAKQDDKDAIKILKELGVKY